MKLMSIVALLGLCAVAVNSQLAAAPGLGLGVGGVPGLPFLPPVVPGVIGLPAFRPLFGARRALLWSLGAFPFGFFGPFLGKRDVESVSMPLDEIKSSENKVQAQREVEKVLEEKIAKAVRDAMPSKAASVEKVEKADEEKKVEAREVVKTLTLRDVEAVLSGESHTQCVISSKDEQVSCEGLAGRKLSCKIRSQIESLGDLEFNIKDLNLIRDDKQTEIVRLVAAKSEVTAVNPKTKEDVVISIFKGKHADLVGFEVIEPQCWSQIGAMIGTLRPHELKINLIIDH